MLLHEQGHEARTHADLTDRDRDESSRRAISAWVRTNPQTQVRMRSAARCPRFLLELEAGVHVRGVMTKMGKTITPTVAARDAGNVQRRWQYRVRRGRVWFDKELREAHRKLRQSIPAYILEGSLLSLLTAPIIYS